MALSKRIFIFYFLFVALCSYFMVHLFSRQVYPSVRQTTEETLVDTANFLAEMVSFDLKDEKITASYLQQRMQAYKQRNPKAKIWAVDKKSVSLNIYITDKHGIVLFDSENKAIGKDYSNWRDVHLTLAGKYGARSSKNIANQGEKGSSTIMYVAAPIYYNNEIIGVLTVSKPNNTTDAYVESAKSELIFIAFILFSSSLLVGAFLSWWLGISFRKLIDYAKRLGRGEKSAPPMFYAKDLNVLASTLSNLRKELDGKEYIEHYINSLTHELKSPLAAIRGASELLQTGMSQEMQIRFLKNIDTESRRLQNLIDQVLQLSLVEKKEALESLQNVDFSALIKVVLESFGPLIEQKQLIITQNLANNTVLMGDSFLLAQALSNILSNAIDFAPRQGQLDVSCKLNQYQIEVNIYNQGPFIPDYAFSRLYERFYSLPRPDTGEKSTGLGLNFVKEIIALHKGDVHISNQAQGVNVKISIPQNIRKTH